MVLGVLVLVILVWSRMGRQRPYAFVAAMLSTVGFTAKAAADWARDALLDLARAYWPYLLAYLGQRLTTSHRHATTPCPMPPRATTRHHTLPRATTRIMHHHAHYAPPRANTEQMYAHHAPPACVQPRVPVLLLRPQPSSPRSGML
jgi:hypothetical protein